MKIIFALLLLSYVAQAKTFDIRDVKPRRVMTAQDGSRYVQVRSGDELYEEYRAVVRSLISDEQQDYASQQLIFKDDDARLGFKRKFIGFELPSLTKIYGVESTNRVMGPREPRVTRPFRVSPIVDSDSSSGAVFVPTCRNPQGPLDLDDPMNQRQLSCYPSIMIFRKLR